MSNPLWPHGPQHARFHCSPFSRTLRKFVSTELVMLSNCLIFCHTLLILPSIVPASESFPVSQLFTSGGRSAGASASDSALSMNIQGWFPSASTGLICLLFKELSRVIFSTTFWKHQLFSTQLSLWSKPHICTWVLTEKNIGLTRRTFAGKVMSLLSNTLSRFVIAFLPKSKCLLIIWLKLPSAMILEAKKIKTVTVSTKTLLFAVNWWDQMPWS